MNEIQNIDTLTTEILILKQQTAQNIIEIGKRLIAAKESLPHGGWGNWLKEKVEFTDRTAQRFMKVANEFSNATTLSDLPKSKAFALLDLPQEDRETFVKENPVNEMTTRELQKAIKEKQDLEEKLKESRDFSKKAHELASLRGEERDNVLKKLEDANKIAIEKSEEAKRLENALQVEKDKLKKEKERSKEEIAKLQSFIGEAKVSGNDEEVERLQAALQEIQNDLDSSAQKIDELESQLKAKPIDVITAEPVIIEKVPEEVQRELEELRNKTPQNTSQPIIRFKIYFDEIQKKFREELEVMAEIKEAYPDTYEKCKRNVLNLINSMAEVL